MRSVILFDQIFPGMDSADAYSAIESYADGRVSICLSERRKINNSPKNLLSYLKTMFVRFLVAQMTSTQHISKGSFSFVPVQDFSKPWTDAELYKKYKLTKDEISFIESTIRPME